MIEIDEELHTVLKQVAIDTFIDKKVSAFEKDYPRCFDCAGKKNVRKFLKYAMRKAERYNMLAEREVNGLIMLMYHLGCDFDLDPQYPWARFKQFPDKTYKEDEPESFVHLKKVGNAFLQFRQQTEGEGLAFKKAACQRLSRILFEHFYPFTDDSILKMFQRIYPERYACIPENAWRGPVMQAAQSKSFEYDLDAPTGKVVFAVLIFMFGISVNADPLHTHLMHKMQTIDRGNIRGFYKEQLFFNHLKTLVAADLCDMENQEES